MGSDYMIPVGRDEILSRFIGIPAVLNKPFINYILLLHVKSFVPARRDPSCTAGIPLCQEGIFPCNHFSPPKWDEKVIQHMLTKEI